jgi:hypothetical protein
MNHENDPEFDSMNQANRQAIDRLRSLTEDLTAVVEHEKRLVKGIKPILESQRMRAEGKKESPNPAPLATDSGNPT